MARLLWLADELRAAGLDVIEVDGWKTRGSDSFSPRGIVCHHTATPERVAGDYPSLNVVKNGHGSLPGPLSQLGLGRSGKVYVIASGRANHAGTGGWRGLKGNTSVLGIEAEDSGDGVWHSAQLAVYKTLCAVLVRKMGISVSMVCGHKEWAPTRKIDPAGINMNDFRAQVSDILTGTLPRTDEEDELNAEQDKLLKELHHNVNVIGARLAQVENLAYMAAVRTEPEKLRELISEADIKVVHNLEIQAKVVE